MRTQYVLARLAIATLEYSPRTVAWALGRFYGKLLGRIVPRLRRTARQNLEMAYPGIASAEQERIIDGVFASIGRLLVTMARFPGMRRETIGEWIRYEGLEHFHEAKRRGKGVLFATAHLGNWELSAFAHGLITEPMHVVARPLDNPYIDRLVSQRRTLSGNHIIDKKDFARGILRALAANQAVGILIDQNSAPEEGTFVDFFGAAACAFTGFAKIAHRSGAAVIPGYALWLAEEGRYVLRFEAPVEMTGDAEADTRMLQKRLEQVIRQYPDQWLWIHRRWKTRPAGEKPLYQ